MCTYIVICSPYRISSYMLHIHWKQSVGTKQRKGTIKSNNWCCSPWASWVEIIYSPMQLLLVSANTVKYSSHCKNALGVSGFLMYFSKTYFFCSVIAYIVCGSTYREKVKSEILICSVTFLNEFEKVSKELKGFENGELPFLFASIYCAEWWWNYFAFWAKTQFPCCCPWVYMCNFVWIFQVKSMDLLTCCVLVIWNNHSSNAISVMNMQWNKLLTRPKL